MWIGQHVIPEEGSSSKLIGKTRSYPWSMLTYIGLVVERLRVRIPAEAVRKCSPELTLRADSSSVSVSPAVLSQWHVKDPGHSVKVQVAGYI